MTALRIRTGIAGDLPALREVFRRASLSNAGDKTALLAHPEALLLADAGTTDGRTRVAIMVDRVVGFATMLKAGGVLELEDLFVDPDWMRRGIGRQLVRDCLTIAREGRIDVTANPHSVPFYRAVGFAGRTDVATPFGFGTRMHMMVTAHPGP